MPDIELLVVGAGPQALTLLTYLARHAPEVLERTKVVDSRPWLARWDEQFAAMDIPMLRSACVHHPEPEPYALIDFARTAGRSEEFHGRLGRPGTALFGDFCTHLVSHHSLNRCLLPGLVVRLAPRGGFVDVTLDDGTQLCAAHVVMATNPVSPVLPGWLHDARVLHGGEPGLLHSGEFSLARVGDAGRMVVVGGGLTAAQLVAGASRAGAEVTWLTRADLRVRDLDIEATWLGPEFVRFQAIAEPSRRVGAASRARGGGSIPPAERAVMHQLVRQKAVRALNGCRVRDVGRRAGAWRLRLEHEGRSQTVVADTVVAATGSRAHVREESLLRPLHRTFGIRHVRGFPALTADLRPCRLPVHLMGPLALTQVGPATRTLIGARIAAERLVAAIAPQARMSAQYPRPVDD
jgi:lysine/ornithine N-monooxygenase